MSPRNAIATVTTIVVVADVEAATTTAETTGVIGTIGIATTAEETVDTEGETGANLWATVEVIATIMIAGEATTTADDVTTIVGIDPPTGPRGEGTIAAAADREADRHPAETTAETTEEDTPEALPEDAMMITEEEEADATTTNLGAVLPNPTAETIAEEMIVDIAVREIRTAIGFNLCRQILLLVWEHSNPRTITITISVLIH